MHDEKSTFHNNSVYLQRKKQEIAMPYISGLVTTLGYVFPAINRAMIPMLEKKGRKAKDRYRQRNQGT